MQKRLKWIIGIPLALVAVGAAVWWFGPWSAEWRYSRTDLVSLRQIVDRDPKNAAAWRQIGLRLARDGDPLAEPSLREALALNPADVEVATGLGELLMATGRLPEAFQVLKAATEHQPKYVPARMALGRLYKRKASYLHASDQFEAAVAADKQNSDGWYELAICYLQMQQAAKAQAAIAEALRLSPREGHYLALKGSVDVAVGNVAEGIEETKQAALLAPRSERIQSTLVNLLLSHQRGPEDLQLAEQAIGRLEQINPQHPLLPYQRGELERLRGNWEAAMRYLVKAVQTSPGQDEVFFALSQTFRRLHRSKDADTALAIYRKRQDLRRQMDEVQIALGSQPDKASLYVRLADLQEQVGDRAGAASSLEAALQITPKDVLLQMRLNKLRRQPAPTSPPAQAMP